MDAPTGINTCIHKCKLFAPYGKMPEVWWHFGLHRDQIEGARGEDTPQSLPLTRWCRYLGHILLFFCKFYYCTCLQYWHLYHTWHLSALYSRIYFLFTVVVIVAVVVVVTAVPESHIFAVSIVEYRRQSGGGTDTTSTLCFTSINAKNASTEKSNVNRLTIRKHFATSLTRKNFITRAINLPPLPQTLW